MNKKEKAALLVSSMLAMTGMTMDDLIDSCKSDDPNLSDIAALKRVKKAVEPDEKI